MLRIHNEALRVLETIGIGFLDGMPEGVASSLAAGAKLSDAGRLLYPRALVEDVLANTCRNWTLHGLDDRYSLDISADVSLYGTAGAAVSIFDFHTRSYRDSMLADLYDITRLCDTLPYIRWCHRPVVARDMESMLDLDINTAYAVASGTGKPLATSISSPENVAPVVALFDSFLGGEGQFAEKPIAHIMQGLGVPPLRFARERTRIAEEAIRLGVPMILGTGPQAGATAPAALAGTVVQSIAEALAAVVYVHAIKPGHPILFGAWPFVSDLRTGAMSGGSGEQAILIAAVSQMGRFYGLPSSVPAGMTDSKVADAQSGFEKGYSTALAGLAGGNMIYEAAGMQASLLGVSLESFVVDNEMLGAIERCLSGIQVTDETLSYGVMKDVVFGEGHYLGHAQTLDLMKSEYRYPAISDRSNPENWSDAGSRSIEDVASDYVQNTLTTHYPRNISERADRKIRDTFKILLPRELMSPGNERWRP